MLSIDRKRSLITGYWKTGKLAPMGPEVPCGVKSSEMGYCSFRSSGGGVNVVAFGSNQRVLVFPSRLELPPAYLFEIR